MDIRVQGIPGQAKIGERTGPPAKSWPVCVPPVRYPVLELASRRTGPKPTWGLFAIQTCSAASSSALGTCEAGMQAHGDAWMDGLHGKHGHELANAWPPRFPTSNNKAVMPWPDRRDTRGMEMGGHRELISVATHQPLHRHRHFELGKTDSV
jgi:hypothetical protein